MSIRPTHRISKCWVFNGAGSGAVLPRNWGLSGARWRKCKIKWEALETRLGRASCASLQSCAQPFDTASVRIRKPLLYPSELQAHRVYHFRSVFLQTALELLTWLRPQKTEGLWSIPARECKVRDDYLTSSHLALQNVAPIWLDVPPAAGT
jgi:hypothetical protein